MDIEFNVDSPRMVHVVLGFPVDRLLAALLESDPSEAPLPAQLPLATVADSEHDMFAALEAEMVSDRLAKAAEKTRRDDHTAVSELLAKASVSGVDEVIDLEVGYQLLQWLNRCYVAQRSAELAEIDATPQVGEAQSTAGMLGLDDDDDDPTRQFGGVTVLLMMLVSHLQEVLVEAENARPSWETVPCCNYDEMRDRPCPGTTTLAESGLEYVCDTCRGRCGSLVHPTCHKRQQG